MTNKNAKTKFIIGIDLGTTNSAVAFIRRQVAEEQEFPEIELYEIPQLVSPGEGAPSRTLPSFLYIAGDYDISAESLWLPWDEQAKQAVGTFAREQGALVPGRLVSSAKSWLCYPDVDRRAKILPWGSDLGEQACSPVEASTSYLKHLRDAWNFEQGDNPDSRFEDQEIVLTVPASFDEEARELTVEAARAAGFANLTLLEEPLAAFYSWIVTHHHNFERYVADGEQILICDVGGGTSDFSLIKVKRVNDEVQFERTAVGEHLLLGGDNVDYSLAYQVELKMPSKLTLQQKAALLRRCCAAKEQLLEDDTEQQVMIRLAGSGSSLVGGLLQAELTRAQVMTLLLDGFLPISELAEPPHKDRRVGLREIGLPYESDPAITRHLAAFLHRAGANGVPIRPDAVLFNGGFFKPPMLRVRLAEALMHWFDQAESEGWTPKLLSNDALDTAVAIGAAYYGFVRKQGGIRVGSGSARAYYIGLQQEEASDNETITAVCVLPRGTEEGTRLLLDSRLFELQANRPVSFTLWSSTTRQGDALGDIIQADPADLHPHSPLVTIIRYGKRTNDIYIPVKLVAQFTEVGTLEIWCESQISEHRWRLQFQLRKNPQIRGIRLDAAPAETGQIVEVEALEQAKAAIAQVFVSADVDAQGRLLGTTANPVELVGRLEEILSLGRDSWPLEIIRKLADYLNELAEGRKFGAKYEARWLNLYGFCLRPGFGDPVDEWRLQQARKIYHKGLSFPDDDQCQAEWMVLWRRIGGGLTKGQQLDLYTRTAQSLMPRNKRKVRLNPQVDREGWRMLASLELVPLQNKLDMGNALIERIQEGQVGENELWSLGRVGARIPLYATIDTVVSPARVSKWIDVLLEVNTTNLDALVAALVQLGARTDDPTRDISEYVRQRIIKRLQEIGKQLHLIENLQTYIPPERRDGARIFGESLPAGLRLVY